MTSLLSSIIIVCVALPFINARSVFGGMMCKDQSDCTEDQCCAVMSLTKSSSGFCMPAKQLGDRCTPSFIYGKSFTCGCKRGLSCALVEMNKKTRRQNHRCVKVLPQAKEIKESSSTETSSEDTGLTAELFRTLLKSYSAGSNVKPDSKKTT